MNEEPKLICDIENLPEEIKQKAKEYAKSIEHSYADTREELEEDAEQAWLQGFAFCLLGKVKVEMKKSQLAKVKELLNEFMRISKASDEDFEHDYSELIAEAEQFIKGL